MSARRKSGIVLINPKAGASRLGSLMTVEEIAALLGVRPRSVHAYRGSDRSNPLPEPDATINGVPVWRRSVVLEWRKSRPGSGYRSDIWKPDGRR